MEEILSDNLRRYRKMRGFTQPELAEKAGISYRMVQQIEYKTAAPSLVTIHALAHSLGVSVGTLLEENVIDRSLVREKLLVSLLEEVLKLDDDALATVLEVARVKGARGKALEDPVRRLKDDK